MPPYYNKSFFDTIKNVVKNTPLNPVNMTVNEWSKYLLEENVTMERVEIEGELQDMKCRVEQLWPDNDWSKSFQFVRLRGLPSEIRSFNFKLIHQLLPFNDRLSQLLKNNVPNCLLCTGNFPESPLHGLFKCEANYLAAQFLLHLSRPFDASINEDRALLFNIACDPLYELPVLLTLSWGMFFIWKNRTKKKSTNLYQIRAEIECMISLLRRSRASKLREAGDMVANTIANFPFIC